LLKGALQWAKCVNSTAGQRNNTCWIPGNEMKYLIALIAATTLPVLGAEHTNAPVEAELDDLPEARPAVSMQIVQRLRREGDGWVFHDQDREKLSITLTNQQGNVRIGAVVSKLAPYGLLIEDESGAFWCGWAELPLDTREKYKAMAAQAQRIHTAKTFVAASEPPRRPARPPVARLDPVSEKPQVQVKKLVTEIEVADYMKHFIAGLRGIREYEYKFPKTDLAKLACKEITSELKQIHKVLEFGTSYARFSDLLQEKILAVQKIQDLRGDGLPREFLSAVDSCLKELNDSRKEWNDEIKAEGSKMLFAYLRQRDWLESENELLYCIGIAENKLAIDEIFKQEARIVAYQQAAVKKGLTHDIYPLLPEMTQEEIVARLKAAIASTKAGPR